MILGFVKFINTYMTIRSIDWANPKEQDQHQDMGIHWMTEANIKRPLQKCDYLNKETEFWIGSDTKEQSFLYRRYSGFYTM